jgi:hypothetical protein
MSRLSHRIQAFGLGAGRPRENLMTKAHPDPHVEAGMEDLQYKMIMALNAADLGNPMCEQAAAICAEIADQHCTQLHVTATAHVISMDGLTTRPARVVHL